MGVEMIQASKISAVEFIALMEAGQESTSNMHTYFKRGDFTDKDILEAYKLKDTPRFEQKVLEFTRGYLFKAQRQIFQAFLDGRDLREDKYRAWEYLSIESSAQQKHADINLFIQSRIHCLRPSASEMEKPGAHEALRNLWFQVNQRNSWDWENLG